MPSVGHSLSFSMEEKRGQTLISSPKVRETSGDKQKLSDEQLDEVGYPPPHQPYEPSFTVTAMNKVRCVNGPTKSPPPMIMPRPVHAVPHTQALVMSLPQDNRPDIVNHENKGNPVTVDSKPPSHQAFQAVNPSLPHSSGGPGVPGASPLPSASTAAPAVTITCTATTSASAPVASQPSIDMASPATRPRDDKDNGKTGTGKTTVQPQGILVRKSKHPTMRKSASSDQLHFRENSTPVMAKQPTLSTSGNTAKQPHPGKVTFDMSQNSLNDEPDLVAVKRQNSLLKKELTLNRKHCQLSHDALAKRIDRLENQLYHLHNLYPAPSKSAPSIRPSRHNDAWPSTSSHNNQGSFPAPYGPDYATGFQAFNTRKNYTTAQSPHMRPQQQQGTFGKRRPDAPVNPPSVVSPEYHPSHQKPSHTTASRQMKGTVPKREDCSPPQPPHYRHYWHDNYYDDYDAVYSDDEFDGSIQDPSDEALDYDDEAYYQEPLPPHQRYMYPHVPPSVAAHMEMEFRPPLQRMPVPDPLRAPPPNRKSWNDSHSVSQKQTLRRRQSVPSIPHAPRPLGHPGPIWHDPLNPPHDELPFSPPPPGSGWPFHPPRYRYDLAYPPSHRMVNDYRSPHPPRPNVNDRHPYPNNRVFNRAP